LRHAGTELVALDDQADERLQVVGAVARTETAERVGTRSPVAQLERHLGELVSENIGDGRTLLAHPLDRRVESEARLETYHHEVEGVGERLGDRAAPAAATAFEPEVGERMPHEPDKRRNQERVAEWLARRHRRYECHERRPKAQERTGSEEDRGRVWT